MEPCDRLEPPSVIGNELLLCVLCHHAATFMCHSGIEADRGRSVVPGSRRASFLHRARAPGRRADAVPRAAAVEKLIATAGPRDRVVILLCGHAGLAGKRSGCTHVGRH